MIKASDYRFQVVMPRFSFYIFIKKILNTMTYFMKKKKWVAYATNIFPPKYLCFNSDTSIFNIISIQQPYY